MEISEVELKSLLKNLGYSTTGSLKSLRETLLLALFESTIDFSELSEEDQETLERFALTLPAEELIGICDENNLPFCQDKEFWIEKISREFKADISLLETYSAGELRDIYEEAISNEHVLSVFQFLKQNIKLKRGGIIPMIKRGGYTFYGLGLDQSSGDITEFAGGREGKDKDMLETALREFEEETFGIFNITREMVEEQNNDVLFDNYSCIFFVEIGNKNMMGIVDKFNNKVRELGRKKIKIENGLLFWVTEEQLRNLLAIQRPNPKIRPPVFFHYPTRRLLTYKFGNINDCK